VLSVIQEAALRDWENAAEKLAWSVDPATPLAPGDEPARRLEKEFTGYFADRGRIRLDPEGRAAKNTYWDVDTPGSWRVSQMLVDPENRNDWEAQFEVDLAASRAENRPILKWLGLKKISP
jgi:hypothetical protein